MLTFFYKLTWKKITNATKILLSYYMSRITKKAKIKGLPISLSFEPTTSCNLRCPECPSGLREFSRPTGMASKQLLKKIVDETKKHLCTITFYFQGEPYLNPNFLEMVQYASEQNIYTITSTNAHFLTTDNAKKTITSGLDRLIVSLDGTDQENYEKYRIGGNFERVIKGIKNLVYWKKKLHSKTPQIILQFLVFRHNQDQVPAIKKLAKSIEVDKINIKTAQINDFNTGSSRIPTVEQYARYTKNSKGQYSLKNKLLNHCWRMWHACVITWDGGVVPCCFDKDATHMLGSIQNKPLATLWKSKPYNIFRNKILHQRKEIDICKNCTEGTKVWI